MKNTELKCAVQAILFASGAPVPLETISRALEQKPKQTQLILDELIREYSSEEYGIKIVRLEDSYQMCSKREYGEYIRRVMDIKRNAPLSQAAMEVLAVIAYNQPVTKAFIEQVRGVDCSGVVGSLTAKGLIEEKGRLELPGRPLLYGTTDNFLRCFQLESLDNLPVLQNQEESGADKSVNEKKFPDGDKNKEESGNNKKDSSKENDFTVTLI